MLNVQLTESGGMSVNLIDHATVSKPTAEFTSDGWWQEIIDEMDADDRIIYELPSDDLCRFGLLEPDHPSLKGSDADELQLVDDIRRPRHTQRLVQDFVHLRITAAEFVIMSTAYHELAFTGVREL